VPAPPTPDASVVIPAHNEADSISRGLEALLADARPGEFDVVVVANGCTDATAETARQAGRYLQYPITVVTSPVASKTIALNIGDSRVRRFPRLYLDADVVCPTSTARALAEALDNPAIELAVGSRRLDLTSASRVVRSYYRAWERLTRVQNGLAGRGCYAFSVIGRSRFSTFPDVVADDLWAVSQVRTDATIIVPEGISVRPPKTLRTLLSVRARVYSGIRRLGAPAEPADPIRMLDGLIEGPRSIPSAVVYLAVTAAAKVRSRSTAARTTLAQSRDVVRGEAS
jgi:glycosyltransferase involved in cell wall biosynthesis